jgi:aspartyl-tRNA(Asn)/glutamyl-tRNA(Gln) amidotransferase subunit A
MQPSALVDLRNAIRERQFSSTEATRNTLGRVETGQPSLHAFLDILTEHALARAKEIDDRLARGEDCGPLAGVPIALKDNICTARGRTTCASKILANYRSPFDAHVVERLHAAGAIMIGKTNMDEFAMGSSTENSGVAPTRNPWNRDCVPGGSSGGSAAAVAARLVPAALGSDTGGSVRQPAAFCGVCGLKPTYGRVSRYGLVAFGSSLDQIGPIAADVRDVALLLRVIAGRDPRDSTSVDEPVPDYLAELEKPLGRVRIGVPSEYFAEGLDVEIRAAIEAALAVYDRLGARRVELSLPSTPYCLPVYYLISSAEASSNLARFDGVHYGHRAARPTDYIDVYSASREEGFGDEVKRRIMLGTYALSSGYYDAYYLKALRARTLVKNEILRAFDSCDVIVCPTSPTPPFRLGERTGDPLAMYLADVYTFGASLSGAPAISIPCGFTSAGLPIGLQLMAPHFAESRLLQIAHAYQRETDWHTRCPPVVGPN